MAITGTPVTRLGLYGGARQIYGDFSPKTESVVVPDVNPRTSAGSGRVYPYIPEKKKRKDAPDKKRKDDKKTVVKAESPNDFQNRIEPETAEKAPLATPLGETLKPEAPEPAIDLSDLPGLIDELVTARVQSTFEAESKRRDALKMIEALERDLREDEPLDPLIEEYLLLLLLV
jgi:hypothetical protein